MCSPSKINVDVMEPTNCVQNLTKHEESLNRFLSELETREQNFTESLKKIGDTLEALVNVKSPEIPEFLLRVPSKQIKKKKNKKRSRSKNQCIDDCTAEYNVFNAIRSTEISEAMDLKDLAKKFEKFLKKAKKHGLSRLVEPIKESARRLRELSQVECNCEFETTLDTDQQKQQIRSTTDSTKICTSIANKEIVDSENGGATPCNCSESSDSNEQELCICDTCEQMCDCPEIHLTRAPDTRKRHRHHKPKDKKNPKICPEAKIADYCDCSEAANVCEQGKINDNCDCAEDTNICEDGKIKDNCDCSEDTTINVLQFDLNKTQDHSIISESCTKVTNKRETSKSCEDLAFGQCLIDPECLKNDLCILRSLLQNLTTIGKLVIDRDRDKKDPEVSRCLSDGSMIQTQKSDKKMALKDDATNVKDQECQCVGDTKESGRTNRSKRRLKDQMLKDEDGASHEFNVKRCQTSCSSGREASTIDKIARSLLAKEIVILRGCHDDIQSDSEENWDFENYGRTQFDSEFEQKNLEEKNTCPCGCGVLEEPSDQFHPDSCAKVEKSQKNLVQSITMINDQLKKSCPCGCADMLQREGDNMCEIPDDSLLKNKNMQNRPHHEEEDIEKLSEQLVKKIHSIKAKNDELKKLMKTCYCDDDVDEILTLQCSQPPPIRATHSGLTSAIEVLQSKCHTKDRMITVLASELRGSKDVDQIAKNLTAPCLQFTYWDFDQCNLYSYMQKPKVLSPDTKLHKANDKSATERPKKETNQLYQTSKPTNFRIVREICNCLLVSWNVPENIRGLRGYEIVMNSNVVAARVRNPMRTEAVLGPFDLSGSAGYPGSIILTLYAIDSHGQYSEPSSIKY